MPGEDFDIGSAIDAIASGDEFKGFLDSGPSAPPPPPAPAAAAPAPDTFDEEGNLIAPAEPPAAPAPTPAAPAAPDAAATQLKEPPRTWTKEAQGLWAQLPPRLQDEVLKREEDIFKGIEGYKAAATYGNGFKEALAPFEQVMQQYGIDPVKQVRGLMQSHYTLAMGTEAEKAAFVQRLFKDYNLKPEWADPENAPYVAPEVQGLLQKVEALQSRVQTTEAREHEARLAEASRTVNEFLADPKNAYAKELENDILQLLSTKAATSLKDAYEKAVWLNPVVRAKEIARMDAEAKAEVAKKEAEKVAAAKKAAAANVRSSAKTGSAAAATKSMDDTLAETYAKIVARDS